MQNALSVRNLTKRFGEFTAVNSVSFDVEDGKFFSILGPSGCGKTTLLRMIAGFYEPTEGMIKIRDKDMTDVPPNLRPVNLVFQHLALFPMMNVFENIAFGLRRRKEPDRVVKEKVNSILERVGLPEHGEKKINQLSGGQKQRIAIARCLVLEPSVLLLDEPLGALDAKLREHMKVELKKLQAMVGTTFVYITHDQSEAMVMSDHVAVMNSGQFEQIGTPQELYYSPASSFVAQFVGNNNKLPVLLSKGDGSAKGEGQAKGDGPAESDGEWYSAGYENGMSYRVGGTYDLAGDDVEYDMFIRPEAIVINPDDGEAELNRMECVVKAFLFDGGNSQLLMTPQGGHQELTVTLPQNRRYDHIRRGDHLTIGWHPGSAVCFPRMEVKFYDDI
ncbi:MAG: ABC transporter ATP-binding protein [Alkalispirochaeta sp.]